MSKIILFENINPKLSQPPDTPLLVSIPCPDAHFWSNNFQNWTNKT